MMATLRSFMVKALENRSRAQRARLRPVYSQAPETRNAGPDCESTGAPLVLLPLRGDHGGDGEIGRVRVRSSIAVANERRILCVFPRYTPSFGTFSHAYRLLP